MIAIGVGQIRGCWTKHFKRKIRSLGGLLKAQPTPWNLESHLRVPGSDYVQGRPEKVLIFPPLTSRGILREKRRKAKVGCEVPARTLQASPERHRGPLGVPPGDLLAGRLACSRNLRTCTSSHQLFTRLTEQRLRWLYTARNIDSITSPGTSLKKQTATAVTPTIPNSDNNEPWLGGGEGGGGLIIRVLTILHLKSSM